MNCNSGKMLFCMSTNNSFEWADQKVLPARCVGCPYTLCFNAMRERVRDNLEQSQLEFDFDYVDPLAEAFERVMTE